MDARIRLDLIDVDYIIANRLGRKHRYEGSSIIIFTVNKIKAHFVPLDIKSIVYYLLWIIAVLILFISFAKMHSTECPQSNAVVSLIIIHQSPERLPPQKYQMDPVINDSKNDEGG